MWWLNQKLSGWYLYLVILEGGERASTKKINLNPFQEGLKKARCLFPPFYYYEAKYGSLAQTTYP